ncbi:MAG: SPOR domain-containing protein [Candidatus Eisenbacteria bacterium]
MPDLEPHRPRSGCLLLAVLISLAIGSAPAHGDLFSTAEELLGEGRIEEARAELKRIADDYEGSPTGFEAFFRWNELEEDGAAYFERLALLAERGDDPRVLVALGRYRFAVGAYRAAADDLEKASRSLRGTEKLDCDCLRGLALAAAGETGPGIDLLLETAERGGEAPPATRARFLAAEAIARRGDLERAASVVEPLVHGTHDFSAPALLLSARLSGARGQDDRAARLYEEIRRRYPRGAGAEEAHRSLDPGDRSVLPGFYVQVGSFEDQSNARRFVAAERARGIGAIEVYRSDREDRTFYQVRIGPFATAEETATARENLERHGLPGDIVREHPEEK